jgi:predicted Zn-dependent protease
VESRTEDTAARAALQTRLSRLQGYLAGDAHNVQLLGDVADLQLQLGLWDDAKATLGQLLQRSPTDATARYRLAVAERATGHAQAAQPLLAGLVAEGHSHPAVLQELARSEAQLGRWDATLAALAPLDAGTLAADQADTVRLLRVRALHHLGDLKPGDRRAARTCRRWAWPPWRRCIWTPSRSTRLPRWWRAHRPGN